MIGTRHMSLWMERMEMHSLVRCHFQRLINRTCLMDRWISKTVIDRSSSSHPIKQRLAKRMDLRDAN